MGCHPVDGASRGLADVKLAVLLAGQLMTWIAMESAGDHLRWFVQEL